MSDSRGFLPREPQRARGRTRFETLLDSVNALLADREAGEITIQDVAHHAGVPLASVYHYFPSNVALLVGLARRYEEQIERGQAQPPNHAELRQWSDICRIHATATRAFLMSHPAAMKLVLGADSGPQVRDVDREANQRLARAQLATYRRHFILPDSEGLADHCAVGIAISDSILQMSYSRHRTITDEMAEEAWQARIAYLRLYLPERAEKRPVPLP